MVAISTSMEVVLGHVRQRGGILVQAELASDHAATVAIWGGKTSTIAGVSSAMASVGM